MDWRFKTFKELSLEELYEILALRQKVFVVEQDCAYLDADDLDQDCWHLSGWSDSGKLLAYLRVMPPNMRYKELSIGRVLTSPDARGSGHGKQLTSIALDEIESKLGSQPIRISAQHYLEKFYQGFGFQTVSEIYQEDNIPHVEMYRPT